MATNETAAERPPLPPKERKPRKPRAPKVEPEQATRDENANRLALARAGAGEVAPYVVDVLVLFEDAAGLKDVDPAKRHGAAMALAVALGYTLPTVDPLWLVWGGAAAAVYGAYREPLMKRRAAAVVVEPASVATVS